MSLGIWLDSPWTSCDKKNLLTTHILDFTPIDFILWRYFKSKFDGNNSRAIDEFNTVRVLVKRGNFAVANKSRHPIEVIVR